MKRKLFFVVIAIIMPVIFYGLRRNSAPFFSTQAYQCVCPQVLSEDYFSSIDNALVVLLNEQCVAHQLIDQLQKQFPVLNKIMVSYKPNAVHIAMSARKPVCCINDTIVLTACNQFFPKNCFATLAVADIPYIQVQQEDMKNVPSFVASLLHDLPADFNDAYDLEFMSENYVRLVDKKEPNFVIAVTVAQENFSVLLAQCESVKNNIAERAGFNKGVKWIADTRFADYIVAYKT